ncbi:MAG: hypothetical protein KA974_00905 [Saprospiraceae bacterium]|nr:hypothetical protein [Saprospiraceae bacterium]MBP7679467.1 hypothetical protein [Saprospiraceae bacterium]
MENPIINKLTRTFSVELPELESIDDYVDFIIPKIYKYSEDLYESDYYIETRWLEVRDDDNFLETVLHIFRDKGEYLQSVDGNIARGGWQVLDTSNTLILNQLSGNSVVRSELYDLIFLNSDFLILKKHGDQQRKGQRKYFVLANEMVARGLEWREVMDLLYNLHRGNSRSFNMILFLLLLIALIILYFSYR